VEAQYLGPLHNLANAFALCSEVTLGSAAPVTGSLAGPDDGGTREAKPVGNVRNYVADAPESIDRATLGRGV
jgi:hypothetical protein